MKFAASWGQTGPGRSVSVDAVAEVWVAMEQVVHEGKVLYIGRSSFAG